MWQIRKIFCLNFWKAAQSYFHGLTLFRKHDFRKSIEKFEKALSFEFDFPFLTYSCYKYIGVNYYYLQDMENAKLYLEKAFKLIKESPSDSELYAHLGLVYDSQANLVRAKECYLLALKYFRSPDVVDAGLVRERLGKIDDYFRGG